jgi:hypothetical protein
VCSEANPTEEALQQSDAAFTNTLQTSFQQAFGAQSNILAGLTKQLQATAANPSGFSPAMLTAMRTQATTGTAQQTQAAQQAANAYIAAHGGADLGSGVGAQITGQVQSAGLQAQTGAQTNIGIANAQQQQTNYWNAIGGLGQVANAYNPTGFANAATNASNATTNASNAIQSEQQQSWQNAFGVVQGVAGLASAAAGIPSFGGGSGSGSTPGVSATGIPGAQYS